MSLTYFVFMIEETLFFIWVQPDYHFNWMQNVLYATAHLSIKFIFYSQFVLEPFGLYIYWQMMKELTLFFNEEKVYNIIGEWVPRMVAMLLLYADLYLLCVYSMLRRYVYYKY